MKIALWVRSAEHAGLPYTSMPAYAVIPMLPCLVYARGWTLTLATISTILIWRMHSKGRTLPWVLNRIKGRLHGNRLSARPIWYIRRFCSLFDLSQ